jgi:hypothetical protein
MLLFAAFIGAIVAVAFGAMKSSDVYKGAVSLAASDARVVEALGTPLQTGWWLSGNIKIVNDTGTADLTIPLSGPRGKGSLAVKATKDGGAWEYQRLILRPEGGEAIDLKERGAQQQ